MPKNHKFLRQLVLVQICILSLAVLVYAWFTSSNYAGSKVEYYQRFLIGTRELKIKTYEGTKDPKLQQVTYKDTELTLPFEFKDKLPGDHQYFMTVIENNDLDAPAELSLYLDNISYSSALGGLSGNWVKIEVTYPAVMDTYLPAVKSDTIAQDTDAEALATLPSVRLTDTLYIPAATQDGETITPGKAYVYWNVAFSEDIDSSAENSEIQFTKFRVMYNS